MSTETNSSAQVDLSGYDNSWYRPGAGLVKRMLWMLINAWVFQSRWLPFYGLKRSLLRFFGAKIGKGVLIKPAVNIKYPWLLEIGDHSWIGERVWIDNLTTVKIGANCCLSQGAMLLTGNHDFSKTGFDLMVASIILEDGAWIGAKAIVGPGVTVGSHAVLSVGSVASSDLDPWTIYRGNPAQKVKVRQIQTPE